MDALTRRIHADAEQAYFEVKRILATCQSQTKDEHLKAHFTELAKEANKAIDEIRINIIEVDKKEERNEDEREENEENYGYLISRKDQLEHLLVHAANASKREFEVAQARLTEVERLAFSHKAREFSDAQKYHQLWATICVFAVSVGLALVGLIVYCKIKEIPLESKNIISNNILIFNGLGKLSFLLFCIWSIHQPRKVGIGIAFAMGLLMDVHDAVYLGENALAYTLLSYFAISIHRRVLRFPPLVQSFQVFPLFLGILVIKLCVRLVISSDSHFPGWLYFLECVVTTALWPIATWLLLAPQRRPIDKDETRPI